MAQSLCKLYVHVIFHIKTNSPIILTEDLGRMHAYIGQLTNQIGCKIIKVGGVEDHIHILLTLSRTDNIAHVVEELKRNSSRWIKSLGKHYRMFSWQNGYGAFSVSQSVVNKTIEYISLQHEHHMKHSFKKEYISLLNLYNVEYDEKYLFND